MIERTFDAARFNAIVNDPSVKPFVAQDERYIDASAQIADERNVCLIGEHGAFLCIKYYNGCYEFHMQVVAAGRGRWAKLFSEAGAQYMFTATDCTELLTQIPHEHTSAVRLAGDSGFRETIFNPPSCWWNGSLRESTVFSLTIQEWSTFSMPDLQTIGRLLIDSDNDEHCQVLGTCAEMIRLGQEVKGIVWYNRYAYACKKSPMVPESMSPLVVRFGDRVLRFDGEAVKVE